MTIVTTSDRYHHLLPVFLYLYKKYWNEPFTLLGYDKPVCELPDNCTWHSMGKQGPVNEWSTDIRRFVEQQDASFFTWIMEDTLLKAPVDFNKLRMWQDYLLPEVGRIDLTNDVCKRPHRQAHIGRSFVDMVFCALPDTRYRQSTQPAIWNKSFLLKYLTHGLTPWEFETQPTEDNYMVLGSTLRAVFHNEGVTKRDIYKLNLDDVAPEDIEHIKNIAAWLK